MLQSLEDGEGFAELSCASHVQQLLGKLPTGYVANYARFCRTHRPGVPCNLIDFANWLEEEAECQAIVTQSRDMCRIPKEEPKSRPDSFPKSQKASATILHGVSDSQGSSLQAKQGNRCSQPCPFCEASDHHLSVCPDFRQMSCEDVRRWIKNNDRCWRCARKHRAINCDLKKNCPKCNRKHLGVLHEVNQPFQL